MALVFTGLPQYTGGGRGIYDSAKGARVQLAEAATSVRPNMSQNSRLAQVTVSVKSQMQTAHGMMDIRYSSSASCSSPKGDNRLSRR